MMRHRTQKLVVACMLLLALGTSNASAIDDLEVYPGGSVTASSLGTVTFETSAVNVVCELSLTGTLRKRSSFTANEPLGSVTGVSWRNCRGGEVRTALGLPWTLVYSSFLGALPTGVTGLQSTLNGVGVSFTTIGVECLYQANLGLLLAVSGRNPYTSGLLTTSGTTFSKVSGGAFCPATGRLRGTFGVTPRQEIVHRVRLPIEANPGIVSVADAAGAGADVTFTAIVTGPINTPIAMFEGATGWRTEAEVCRRAFRQGMAAEETCRMRFRSEAGATAGRFVYQDAAGNVAAVTLRP